MSNINAKLKEQISNELANIEARHNGVMTTVDSGAINVIHTRTGRTTHFIPLEELYEAPPEWNFYKKASEAEMEQLVYTILTEGLQHPIVVWHRPCEEGKYMILSGHKRSTAYRMINDMGSHNDDYSCIECLVRGQSEITEDEAVRIIVTTNFNTRSLSLSERIQSIVLLYYRYRYKDGGQAEIAKILNLSKKTVENYLKLAELLPKLIEWVEEKYLTINGAVNIARLEEDLQFYILRNYEDKFKSPIVGKEYRKRAEKIKSTFTETKEIDMVLNPPSQKGVSYKKFKVEVPEHLEEAFKKMYKEWLNANDNKQDNNN